MKLCNFISILSFHKAKSAGVHDDHTNTGKKQEQCQWMKETQSFTLDLCSEIFLRTQGKDINKHMKSGLNESLKVQNGLVRCREEN